MADPRRIRERLGFGYGAPSPAMSALEPFHAGVDPQYMPQDVVTESSTEGPRGWVRSGLESLFGAIAPSDRAASNMAEKVTNLSDFVNVPQEAFDFGKALGDAWQGGDKVGLAMSMIPGKAADEIVPAVKAAQKQIKAYHGSPHGFEKFDISKIGTGEGAQAYGHGLYFAENDRVAEGYRDALSKQVTFKGEPLNTHPMDSDTETAKHSIASKVANGENPRGVIINEAGEWRQAAEGYARYVNDMSLPPETREAAARQVESFNRVAAEIEKFDPADFAKNPGHLYEVNINADPDAFLDWDKPLSEHSEATRQAIAAAAANFEPRGPLAKGINQNLRSGNLDLTGEQAYTGIGGLSGGPEKTAASEVLRQAGVPGIKYLDAGSRVSPRELRNAQSDLRLWDMAIKESGYGPGWTPEGHEYVKRKAAELEAKAANQSRNYVVFSDEIIDIVKKYGIAGALGAGLITQQMADQLQAQQGGGQS